MESVLKIRWKIGPQDAAALDGQSRICNWAYNYLLETCNEYRKKFIEQGDKDAGK